MTITQTLEFYDRQASAASGVNDILSRMTAGVEAMCSALNDAVGRMEKLLTTTQKTSTAASNLKSPLDTMAKAVSGGLQKGVDVYKNSFTPQGLAISFGINLAWQLFGNDIMTILDPALKALEGFAGFVHENIDVVAPLARGLLIAAAAFELMALKAKLATVFTTAWTGVQTAFNAVMAANPLVLTVMAVAALVGVIYAVVAAFNKATGSALSATGMILGTVAGVAAGIANVVLGVFNGLLEFLWGRFATPIISVVEWMINAFSNGFNSFGDGVKNLLGQIAAWFLSLGQVVGTVIDAIFGSDFSARVEKWQEDLRNWGKNENAITLNNQAPVVEKRFAYGEALAAGTAPEAPNVYDWSRESESRVRTVTTVSNVENVEASVDIPKEDLRYLVDLAEMRYIQKYVTLTPTVAMTATISQQVDVESVADIIARRLEEEYRASAEGVYE